MTICWGSFGLGSLLGLLIAALVNHHLAKGRSQQEFLRKRFVEAGDKFRESFQEELVFLDPTTAKDGDVDACDVLSGSYTKHLTAKNAFQQFLDETKRREFERAWFNYCGYDEDGKFVPYFEQYSSKISGYQQYREACALAKGRIEKFLEFTKT